MTSNNFTMLLFIEDKNEICHFATKTYIVPKGPDIYSNGSFFCSSLRGKNKFVTSYILLANIPMPATLLRVTFR